MADSAAKTQERHAETIQKISNEAQAKAIEASEMFQDRGLRAFQEGVQCYQEIQVEAIRAAGDLTMIQWTTANRLTSVVEPGGVVAVSQEGMQAWQNRTTAFMDRMGQIAERQMKALTGLCVGT